MLTLETPQSSANSLADNRETSALESTPPIQALSGPDPQRRLSSPCWKPSSWLASSSLEGYNPLTRGDMKEIRIMLVDDHALVREGTR